MNLDCDTSKTNRELWKSTTASAGEALRRIGLGTSVDDDRAACGTLQNAAHVLVTHAFNMIAGGGDEYLISEALNRAIRAAEEAMRMEDFDRLYRRVKEVPGQPGMVSEDETFKPTARQIETERIHGRMRALEALSYALWFRDGQRPMNLFRESVETRRHYYKRQAIEFDELILNSAQVGDYEFVRDRCVKKVSKAVLPPKGGQFKRNDNYILYLLSEYALGRQELEGYVREGISYKYELCRMWETALPTWSPWWIRVGWAYLWGKHFSGVTEARPLIHELRGY